MAYRQKLTRIKFLSIARDIKLARTNNNYSAKQIGLAHHVSRETVNAVARHRTWPAFITAKQLRNTLVARRKQSEFDASQKPVKIADAPTAQKLVKSLDKGLKKLHDNPVEYVTRKEFTDALDSINRRRIDLQEGANRQKNQIHDLQIDVGTNTTILNRIQQLKPRWFRKG